MTSPNRDFGFPKSKAAAIASNKAPTSSGDDVIGPVQDSPEAAAQWIAGRLLRLQERNSAAQTAAKDIKYQMLEEVYDFGLRLRADEEVRNTFFALDVWKGFRGHKPNPERHGCDEAVKFSVMLFFGGAEDRRQEASMFASACWILAKSGVSASEFRRELGARGGPKKLAAEAAAERRESKRHVRSGRETTREVGEAAAREIEARSNPSAAEAPTVTLAVPLELADCKLPAMTLFYDRERDILLLSALPGRHTHVHVKLFADCPLSAYSAGLLDQLRGHTAECSA